MLGQSLRCVSRSLAAARPDGYGSPRNRGVARQPGAARVPGDCLYDVGVRGGRIWDRGRAADGAAECDRVAFDRLAR